MFIEIILRFFRESVSGLLDVPSACKVVFHVIIPKQYWEWDDKSKVFIHFGHSRLGNWLVDIGNFVQRYVS